MRAARLKAVIGKQKHRGNAVKREEEVC